MANVIKVVSKSFAKVEDSKIAYAYGLDLVDNSTGVVVPSNFLQTDACTAAFVGVTKYGSVIFSTENTSSDDVLSITAHPIAVSGSGSDVTVAISVSGLIALGVGDTVTTDQ